MNGKSTQRSHGSLESSKSIFLWRFGQLVLLGSITLWIVIADEEGAEPVAHDPAHDPEMSAVVAFQAALEAEVNSIMEESTDPVEIRMALAECLPQWGCGGARAAGRHCHGQLWQ